MNDFFKNDFFKNFQQFDAQNFSKNFAAFDPKQFSFPQVEMGELMNLSRKNIEAFSSASKVYNEYAQTAARRGAEFFRENMESAMENSREMMTGTEPSDNAQRQAEFTQKAVQTTMDQFREEANNAAQSQKEALEILQNQFNENIDEAQKLAKKAA